MIYAITSKRKGCGRTTVALLTSLVVQAAKPDSSTVLVDLSSGKDLNSILNIANSTATIDTLISRVFMSYKDLDVESCTVDVSGFKVIPGTAMRGMRYLEKRVIELRSILQHLDSIYNTVILDIDYDLMEELQMSDVDITPIHIIDQNILNYSQYKKEFVMKQYEGFYVLNKYSPIVYPNLDQFYNNFKKGSLFCVEYDADIVSMVNKQKLTLKELKHSKLFEGVNGIAHVICNNITVVKDGTKKKRNNVMKFIGFILDLFNTKQIKPAEVNSISHLQNKPKDRGESA